MYDNQYAQSVLLCYLDEEKDEVCLLTGYAEPVRGGKNSVTTVSMDITEYYDDIDEIFVQVDDYALNASLYKLTTGGKYAEQGMQDLSDAIEFPDEISFAQEEITLNINEVAQLTPKIRPADASPTGYYWTSNRPAVAEVKDGEVIGRSEGTALITVYAASSADRSRPYAEIFRQSHGRGRSAADHRVAALRAHRFGERFDAGCHQCNGESPSERDHRPRPPCRAVVFPAGYPGDVHLDPSRYRLRR